MADDASRQPFGLLAGLGAGSVIAGYRIQDRIGVGGMAVVFRARDERLGRLVALKVLAPARAADEEFRARFIREWRAATAVEHPHIIPVYAADNAGDVLYIAMRLVSGGDLRTVIRRDGPLAPGRLDSSQRLRRHWTPPTGPDWCTGTSSPATSSSMPCPACLSTCTCQTSG